MKRSALRLSTLFCAALAACAVAFSPVARAQNSAPKMSFVTVDYPGAATTTSVTGINDFDEIVGIYDDVQGHTHSYAGKKGSTHFTPIDYPGAAQTYVFRINNWGQIVGTYFDKDGYQHGFLRLPEWLTGWTPLYYSFDFPGASRNKVFDYELGTGLGTSAFGLNDLGEMVGQYADQNGVGHGFKLTVKGFTSFAMPLANSVPGFPGGSGLSGINDFGDVAGAYASKNPMDFKYGYGFLVHNNRITLIDPPASILTEVFGINNRQEVSGFYYDANFLGHGYIYSGGRFQIVDVPGAVYISTVGTVNNRNSFVGEYVDGFGVTHGYIGTRN